MDHFFTVRGVVEGFYGTFYTAAERNELIRFLGKHSFNYYLYGPKNDRHHRARWRQPYPPTMMAQFAETVTLARDLGISFCYTISPGESICVSSAEDFACLTAKLSAFYDCGVRAFGLFLDDITPALHCQEDREQYAITAEAHADLSNRLYDWLQGLDPDCTLWACPTDYHGQAPFSLALHELGQRLDPAIDIFYTGPEICAARITTEDARNFAAAVGRLPIIWDNYPVNDLDMRPELHIGPYRGRDATLYTATKGLVANLMLQPVASQIPLRTIADYLADPYGYDPDLSWQQALGEVAGAGSLEALRLFAENSLFSCLSVNSAERLTALTKAALVSLRAGDPATKSAAVERLDENLADLNEACYHLKYYLPNPALRQDLLPWIELTDLWQDMARHALAVLRAREQGQPHEWSLKILREWSSAVEHHPKRIGTDVLRPLADHVLELVERDEALAGAVQQAPIAVGV